MAKRNAVYAQSGGVTAVINASAYGMIRAALASDFIDTVYAGRDGINGVIAEELIDMGQQAPEAVEALRYTPAGAFGSCRRKLKDVEKDRPVFERILQVLDAHDIGYFFYNGGNDSMDTVDKLSRYAGEQGYDLKVIGIPKTIDNDLPETDCCPGFGSAAKYNAVSMMEGSLDTESMYHDSTKVFVLETMGRHAGWLAAATGLAHRSERDGPHLILLPEVPFDPKRFLAAVDETVKRIGFCTITVSEGLRNAEGQFVAEAGGQDAFGHAQLGGAGNYIQDLIKGELGLKLHGAVLDYCQRSGRHLAAGVDVEQAVACGSKSVELAKEGLTGRMVTIVREQDSPYRWGLSDTAASNIANTERPVPPEHIREDGFHVTEAFRRYCAPLIQGEAPPPYTDGLPAYRRVEMNLAPRKLDAFSG